MVPVPMKNSIHPVSWPMLGSFSSSFFGQICKVWYTLKVFVKHDAWNDWGEGHAVDFPIKIKPKRLVLNQAEPVPQSMQGGVVQ